MRRKRDKQTTAAGLYSFPFDIVQSIETFVEMPSEYIDRYWKSEEEIKKNTYLRIVYVYTFFETAFFSLVCVPRLRDTDLIWLLLSAGQQFKKTFGFIERVENLTNDIWRVSGLQLACDHIAFPFALSSHRQRCLVAYSTSIISSFSFFFYLEERRTMHETYYTHAFVLVFIQVSSEKYCVCVVLSAAAVVAVATAAAIAVCRRRYIYWVSLSTRIAR